MVTLMWFFGKIIYNSNAKDRQFKNVFELILLKLLRDIAGTVAHLSYNH